MRKIKVAIGILVAVVLAVLAASGAAAELMIPAADQAKEKDKAPENSPVISEDWGLERVDFIHYAKPDHPGRPPKEPKAPKCYKLLGPKWNSLPVDYVINPNYSGWTKNSVFKAISAGAEEWDSWTGTELFSDVYEVKDDVSYGTQDFVNAASFGNYPEDGVIAVTTVWWSPRGRQIVEFDVMFDTDYTWGDCLGSEATCYDGKVMDLQNIATHELGHGAGLGDVYDTVCSEVTMYGYSYYGETTKRTLEQPDKTGIQQLYGGL